MRSSKWHAHGNVYLVSQDADLTPADVRAQAVATDGILQVLATGPGLGRDRDLEYRRLDGRDVGQRDADRGRLAGRSGRAPARSRSASGRAPSGRGCSVTGSSSRSSAPSRSGRARSSRASSSRPSPSGTRMRSSSATRTRSRGSGRCSRRIQRFPARTNVQVVRVDGPGDRDRPGLGARRGGDERLGHERDRGRGGDARRGRRHGAFPGRRPPGAPRRRSSVPHGPRRTPGIGALSAHSCGPAAATMHLSPLGGWGLGMGPAAEL